jgi:hypothetical protein
MPLFHYFLDAIDIFITERCRLFAISIQAFATAIFSRFFFQFRRRRRPGFRRLSFAAFELFSDAASTPLAFAEQ